MMPDCVAPLVGAWIEILLEKQGMTYFWSRPSWARGLKCNIGCLQDKHHVAPLVGAWIEIFSESIIQTDCPSRPSWARGLKYS